MTSISRRDLLKAGGAMLAAPAISALDFQCAAAADGPYAHSQLTSGEPPAILQDSFTMVLLPDTQNYSEKFPDIYNAQTEWIVKNRSKRNIVSVLHLGDVTNFNSRPEWENAAKAMARLDGEVPYFVTLGNHDYSERGSCSDRATLYPEYFPVEKIQKSPHFGGAYGKEPDRMDNTFCKLDAGGRKFIVLSLEFGPRAEIVQWAGEVAEKHREREIILITHAYMFHDDTRYDWKKYGMKQAANPHAYPIAMKTKDDVNDGEELWQNLVSKNENFILTCNGHVPGDGLGRTETLTPANRNVPQMLVNYQFRPNGGDGWLRLLEFRADGKTISVNDYSPTLGQHSESPQSQFEVKTAPPLANYIRTNG